MIFAGAEHIISPLGQTAEENFNRILAGNSGISKKLCKLGALPPEQLYVGAIGQPGSFELTQALRKSIHASLARTDRPLLESGRTLLLLSTTKGEIAFIKNGEYANAMLDELLEDVCFDLPWISSSQVVSNACISGLHAVIIAHDLIRAGNYDHAIVTGGDCLSEFTMNGFKSFFAISGEVCKPFDKNRSGINLGEGVGTIILSNSADVFSDEPLEFCGGATANDANHISGPSRTGEGLFRAVRKTLEQTGISAAEIGFLSAHGTGTSYNDEMESIAFARAGLSKTPMGGLKGYFGHTLGAAGVIESAICMQSLRCRKLVPSYGFETPGTSEPLNVQTSSASCDFNILLKTASGFGGSNAAGIFRTI